jgi:hypothetical protein
LDCSATIGTLAAERYRDLAKREDQRQAIECSIVSAFSIFDFLVPERGFEPPTY